MKQYGLHPIAVGDDERQALPEQREFGAEIEATRTSARARTPRRPPGVRRRPDHPRRDALDHRPGGSSPPGTGRVRTRGRRGAQRHRGQGGSTPAQGHTAVLSPSRSAQRDTRAPARSTAPCCRCAEGPPPPQHRSRHPHHAGQDDTGHHGRGPTRVPRPGRRNGPPHVDELQPPQPPPQDSRASPPASSRTGSRSTSQPSPRRPRPHPTWPTPWLSRCSRQQRRTLSHPGTGRLARPCGRNPRKPRPGLRPRAPRTHAPGAAARSSNSRKPQATTDDLGLSLIEPPVGFEPTTYALQERCSDQLS